MADFDAAFNKQLQFNFLQRCASSKKNTIANRRASRSAYDDLDEPANVYGVSTTDFRELSRYIMEDLIHARSGDAFLICIAKSYDTSGVHQMAATAQRKFGTGGMLFAYLAANSTA